MLVSIPNCTTCNCLVYNQLSVSPTASLFEPSDIKSLKAAVWTALATIRPFAHPTSIMTHFQDGTTPSAAISPIDVAHKPPSIASEQTGASVQSTSPSLLSMKAAKLKSKIKSKLHRRAGQDGDDDDDDVDEDDEDGLNDDNDAVAATGVVAVDHANSSSNPNANMTAAQMYADEQRAPDDTAARIASPANSFDADKGSPLTKTESIGRRSVDSSRAHARSQSDWKRTAEFHNLFDEITTDEVLISDYTSAWFKDVRQPYQDVHKQDNH